VDEIGDDKTSLGVDLVIAASSSLSLLIDQTDRFEIIDERES
jgi:hypothetical protein